MKETKTSRITGKSYCHSECLRLVNVKQFLFYIKMGVEILDIYPDQDFKTGEDILVFVVDKANSQEAYRLWQEKRNINE